MCLRSVCGSRVNPRGSGRAGSSKGGPILSTSVQIPRPKPTRGCLSKGSLPNPRVIVHVPCRAAYYVVVGCFVRLWTNQFCVSLAGKTRGNVDAGFSSCSVGEFYIVLVSSFLFFFSWIRLFVSNQPNLETSFRLNRRRILRNYRTYIRIAFSFANDCKPTAAAKLS